MRIGTRLADVSALLAEPEQASTGVSGSYLWRPASLGCGYASLAVFYAYLAAVQPGQGWHRVANIMIARAVKATADEPVAYPGLYGGSSGLAFAMLSLAELDSCYQPVADRAFRVVAAQVLDQPDLSVVHRLRDTQETDFDVISGSAGVLTALLAQQDRDGIIGQAIDALIEQLVAFCEPGNAGPPERWRVLPRGGTTGTGPVAPNWYDLGLAHGPLGAGTALAIAHHHGYRDGALVRSVDYVCSWFAGHRLEAADVDWPGGVAADEGPAAAPLPRPNRPVWCYGATGGAQALWWGARATGNPQLANLARAAVGSLTTRRLSAHGLRGASLCHGTAGVLQACMRFAQEHDSPVLRAAISRLTAETIGACDAERPFFVSSRWSTGEEVSDPGFLTGAAGVGLALLSAAASVEPRWDRALLMPS